MQLALHEGSRLYSAEGENLGTLERFVVEPSTSDVTHVLVEKGVFFTDDRVVPVDAIDHVEDDDVVLEESVDPASLPKFISQHYARIDDETRLQLDVPHASYYAWRYPIAFDGPYPVYPTYLMPTTRTRRTVDDPRTREKLAESEIISGRTPVVSINGEEIGTVSEIQIDEQGELSHLVVDLGFLSDEKVLPAHWIESVESDAVRLAVGNSALERLETIT